MKKIIITFSIAVALFSTSCTGISKSMREPNTRVNLEKKDFTISDQFTGEATSTKILNIDWNRLFNVTGGSVEKDQVGSAGIMPLLSSIPVIGGIVTNAVSSYALYDVMEKNKGYDVVFYPQFETVVKRPIGIGFLYKITTVKVTTRLAKLNQ